MSLNIVIIIMISVIAFVVFFALLGELRRRGKQKPPSELTIKITNVWRITVLGIGAIIFLLIFPVGLSPTKDNDVSSWMTLVISTGIGIAIAISVGIYSTHSQKKTDELITEIHGYVTQQKKKEALVQADYARNLIFLINWARLKVRSLKIQIKFLKKILQQPFSLSRIENERHQREIIHKLVIELQDIMA